MPRKISRIACALLAAFSFEFAAAQGASATTCKTVTACVFGSNTGASAGSGFAIHAGVSGSSLAGDGIDGRTTFVSSSTRARSGVAGYDNSASGTYDSGVFGFSKSGSGVHGSTGNGTGVVAVATSTTGIPLLAQGKRTAIHARFVGDDFGDSNGIVVSDGYNAFDTGTGIAIMTGSDGIDVRNQFGYGINLMPFTAGGGESIVTDDYDALDIRTDPDYLGGVPIALMIDAHVDPAVLVAGAMSLDTSGNMILSGSLTEKGSPGSMTRTVANRYVGTYSPREADATIEDVGEATVRNGRASVALDPSFGSTIDPRRPYYVFLTAEGENRGLYVTAKSMRGFTIRETGGGSSTLDVQYRIVAKPYDASGKPRLAAINPADMPYSNARTRTHVAKVRAYQDRSRTKMIQLRSKEDALFKGR